MKTALAFQDLTPPPEDLAEFLRRLRDGIGEGFSQAAEESANFATDVVSALVSIVWIAAILILSLLLSRRIRRWATTRATERWPDRPNRATLVDQMFQVAFFVLALIFALRMIGVSPTSTVTAIGIIVGALSIALQDVLKNLVAGVYLLVEEPFRHGDRLSIPGANGGLDGWVESVRMRVTEIRTPQRELMLIPNYILFSEIMVNRTDEAPYALSLRLSLIDVPASRVEQAIQETLLPILGPRAVLPAISLMGAGPFGSAADIRIWFPPDGRMRRDVIVAMNERFPEAFVEVVAG